jgi:hypothetical protein
MPIIPGSYVESDENYHRGYALEEYEGKVSIVAVEIGKDGKTYMKWGFPQFFKDGERLPAEKALPWKIELGNRQRAISSLNAMAALLGGSTVQDGVSEGDIPF